MKLEDIVCDLEYAEKLSDLGVDVDCLFAYCNDKRSITFEHKSHGVIKTYTVAELGEMLPWNGFDYEIICFDKFDDTHQAEWVCGDRGQKRVQFHDPKEANARAKLLIWLIENNHVKVEEL